MINSRKVLMYLCIAFVIVILVLFYFSYQIEKGKISVQDTTKSLLTLLNYSLIAFAVAIIIAFFFFLKKGDKDDKKIEYVDGDRAMEILHERAIVNNGVAHYNDYSENKKGIVRPARKDAVRITNTQGYSHPTAGTPIMRYELHLENIGMQVGEVRLDEGEEKVRNNSLFRVNKGKFLEVDKPDRNFPMATMTDDTKRMVAKMTDEEYSAKEIKALQEVMNAPKPETQPITIPEEQIESQLQQQQLKNMEQIQRTIKK